jgi:ribA/ribD-fused uncharacterized protein
MEINSFHGEYDFLSNFHIHPVEFERKIYPSSEHAFQAAKTTREEDREKIRQAKSPGQAKRMGRKVELRHDWHSIQLETMRAILVAKFADPGLRQKLLATSPAQLVEGNTWNDTFWGVCRGKGQNHLGRLLMEIRDS